MTRALLLVVMALAICGGATAVAAAAPSAPYTANTDCLFCHDASTGSGAVSRVEFDVPAAMQPRCKACHSQQNHWNHYTGNTCGGCHPGRPYVNALYPLGTYWSATSGRFQSAASLSTSPQELHRIHANGSIWQYDQDYIDGTQCNRCHAPAACSSCHGSDPDPATHTAHTQNSPAYPPVTYTQSTGTMAVTTSSTCVNQSCHSLAKAASADFVPLCGTCHPTRTSDHGYDAVQHTADVTATVDGGGKTCGDCHRMALYEEHARTSSVSAAAGCGACHPTPRDSFAAWGQTCQTGGCHPSGSAQEPHVGIDASHTPLSTGDAAVCSDCHSGDLAVVHTDATSTVDPAKTSCLVCHSNGSVPTTRDCTACHFVYDDHPYPAASHVSDSTLANCGGAGCHNTRDLMGAHTEKNPVYTCNDCHGSPRGEVQNAIANGLTACSDCHTGVSEDQAHYTQHEARPPLIGETPAYSPNYAFYTGSAASGLFTRDCAGCHASNLMDAHLGGAGRVPQFDSAGEPLTCDTCHASADPRVVAAIASGPAIGESKCDACHVNPMTGGAGVHGPINQTHASTFKADPEVKCTPCHEANLADEHNGGQSWPDANGTPLVGCDVCHRNFAGARGSQVQAAIQPLNDTKCTACHSASHPDFASHEATTSASMACATCHAQGQATIDIKAVHAGSSVGPCAVCHDNSARVPDIRVKTAECASCHSSEGTDYHRNAGQAHNAPDSQDCVACHETANATTLHAGVGDGCAVCHDNAPRVPALPATTACVNCHGDESPADPDHYSGTESTHTATDGTESGFACSQCHKLEMQPEHDKSTSGTVSCVSCHETKVDGLGGAWSKTCAVCHTTKHTEISTVHDATGIGNADDCGGAGCHQVTDLRAIHANSVVGNDPALGDESCATADCHTSDTAIPTKKSCDSTGCHAGTQPHKHELNEVSSVYTSDAAGGCTSAGEGCHGAATDPSYATFHPASGCTSGPCHTSANHNDPQFDDPNTCQNCHGGGGTLYDGAANVSTLLGSSPSGHYVDSRHTPAVNNASMLGATGGTVVGYCRDCHDPANAAGPDGLYVQHTGLAAWNGKVCSECHNDSAAVTAVVTSDWASGLCSECHKSSVLPSAAQHATDTAPPVNATEAQGPGSCVTSGCHLSLDLHVLHKGSASTPATSELRTQGCAAGDCHDFNEQATKPNKTSCGTGGGCHTTDPHDPAAHNATSSTACLQCHEAANNVTTTDIRAIVRTNGAAVHSCATCHNSGTNLGATNTAECVDCHNSTEAGTHPYSPVDPNHYSAQPHAAENGSEDGYACSSCHSLDMRTEHSKPASGPVSCVQCHETKVDSLSGAWNGQCSTCHATRHTNKNAGHTSSNTSCGGTGCHAINDVSVVHASAPDNCGTCHTPTSTPTSDCGSSGCHSGVTGDHEAQHDTAGVIDSGCYGCHFQSLTQEHSTLGNTCATCHSSTDSAVIDAIAAGDRNCATCHPGSAHNQRQGQEFSSGNASMHRVRSDLPGMRSSFVVNGSTFSWTLPSASSFLKAGYTTSSIVTCDMCHSYSGTTGPHGATMKVNIDPAYPNSYNAVGGSSKTAQLSPNSPTGMSMSDSGSTAAKIICEKCHDLNGSGGSFSNIVHTEHNDRGSEGGYCVHCHASIPHGWGRPRLLAYASDPAPYRTTTGGLARFSIKNYSPSGWNKSDCGAGCSSSRHPLSGSSWPNLVGDATKPGAVAGTVTDDGGAPIAGATVTVGSAATTVTATNGVYALPGLSPATYTLTVSKTGYATWSGSIIIAGNTTTTQNVVLSAAPTNWARNKTVTQSSQYSSTYSGARAVDGNAATYWRSSSSGTQWIVVDLGAVRSIKKFVLDWNSNYYARSYRIETASSSSGPWTQQFSQSSSYTGDRTVTLGSAVNARYVRVYCTSANYSNYQLLEFEVWDR